MLTPPSSSSSSRTATSGSYDKYNPFHHRRRCVTTTFYTMTSLIKPFQLLEVNIISAQDVAPVTRHIRSYAIAWVHPDRKLSTGVDKEGHINPTWNDKFVFRVDEEFLRSDTAAVMVEIYALHWFRDVHVGNVRVLVGNLIPPTKPHHPNHHHHLGMRFVALQVRRPSGRPQGILNIGVALLDSSMRSMPLYTQVGSSAVGYRDLMGEEDPHGRIHPPPPPHHGILHNYYYNNALAPPGEGKHVLRRSLSDRSELERKPTLEDELSHKGDGSMINRSEIGAKGKKKKKRSKHGSLINGSDIGSSNKGKKKRSYSRPASMINGSDLVDSLWKKDKHGQPSSIIGALGIVEPVGKKMEKIETPNCSAVNNGSEVVDPSPKKAAHERKVSKLSESKIVDPPKETVFNENPFAKKLTGLDFGRGTLMTPKPAFSKFPTFDYKGPQKEFKAPPKFNFGRKKSILSESVGPSPSELAADEATSSMMEGWSIDESVEGLRSKLERWRTELPPVYDHGDFRSFPSSDVGFAVGAGAGGATGAGGGTGHVRRHTDGGGGGGGLFSCFGNIYGYECSCICGKPTGATTKGSSGRVHLSPSTDSLNRSYMCPTRFEFVTLGSGSMHLKY